MSAWSGPPRCRGAFARMLDRIAAYLAAGDGDQTNGRWREHLSRRDRDDGDRRDRLPPDFRAPTLCRRLRRQGRGTSRPDEVPDVPLRLHGRLLVGDACRGIGWNRIGFLACSSEPSSAVSGGTRAKLYGGSAETNVPSSLHQSEASTRWANLLNAGVPMLDTLAITADVSGNQALPTGCGERSTRRCDRASKIQTTLGQARTSCRRPWSRWSRRARSRESSGEVLDESSSDYYHRVLRDAIKSVTSMIEPLMIVLMGSVVGFIAMAIILPIFKMSSLVSGG